MRPGGTGVDGLVDTVADREVRTMQAFPAADIDDVVIRLFDGDLVD
jgi:hypothetical protein